MANLAARINDDRYKINRKNKPKEQLLFGLQMKYMELDESINQILSGKKGAEVLNGALYTKGTENNFLNCWKAKRLATSCQSAAKLSNLERKFRDYRKGNRNSDISMSN